MAKKYLNRPTWTNLNHFSSPALFQNDDFSLVLFFHVLAKLSVTLQIFIDLLGGFKGKAYFCKRISRIGVNFKYD